METEALIREQDFVNNPTARVPVCLCLDVSGSMNIVVPGTGHATNEVRYVDGQKLYVATGGVTRLQEMQKGIDTFYNVIRSDERAHDAAEICVVTFGKDGARVIQDFSGIDRQPQAPQLEAGGDTPMGEAVNLALDRLESRKKGYKEYGVDYFQPWLVLMTDGEPNGDQQKLEEAIQRSCDLVNRGRLTVFPMAVCEDADVETLQRFSPKRQVCGLKNMNFPGFFEWLGKSVTQMSHSQVGEDIVLSRENVVDWFDLIGDRRDQKKKG